MDDYHHFNHLTKGSQIEVLKSHVFYLATVIRPPPPSISPPNHHHNNNNNLVYVEYHHIFSKQASSVRLREHANVSYVRPSPLPDSNPPNFKLNDLVDAFYRNGWWTGVITAVVDESNFVVTFKNPPEDIQFCCSDLRIHRNWVGGRWVQPQKQGTTGWLFSVGKRVEVSFDREGLGDVWFPATVLKSLGNSTFLVEYQQPGAGDEAVLHKVTVDNNHIRPSPPHLRDKHFALLEKVDAYYDFGWWSGVVTKELADNRYIVFFKHTKKEREFIYSRVRRHLDWKGGKWFNTSQGDTVVRTTHSLIDNQIEQVTPIIGKQSPVATSIMKSKQKNIKSNNKSSPKDEILNDGSSKKSIHPSVGQSEGFDSEVSGMTDQAFSKTENLSHGKKVRSKRGKNTERKASNDYSSKRGKLTNELKSLQSLSVGSEGDLMKTRTQVIAEKNDATKDFPFVVMGLQCNLMTTSQGKIVQKLPLEQTAIVAKSDTEQEVSVAPLTVVDQEGGTASVAQKRKRGRPPKLQALSPKTLVTDNHEIGSVATSKHSVVEAGQRKEVGLSTSSETKSLEENQGPVNEHPGVGGKQNVSLIKDKLPNENTGLDLHVEGGQGTKKYSARKGKRGKRRTISINTESLTQDSQDASKEKADESLGKDSIRNPEASVGKSLVVVPDDQPLSRWIEGKHSPITVHGPEGAVEQPSKASVGSLEIVQRDMDSGNLPFVRTTSLWKTIESMEAFQKLPQKPHFRPLLEGVRQGAREGLAIGTMVTFSTVVDKTCGLRFDDPRSTIEDCLETLIELEDNGFDVEVIRERLIGLLLVKDKQKELEERSKGVLENIKEQDVQGKKIDEEIEEISRQMRELEERRKQVLLKKEKGISEIGLMKTVNEGIEQEIREVDAEFDGLAAAPLWKAT
ncbi:hypothetical protein SSX86_026962 [Deinandra increscens subsp. villosa]|uniref:Agenet domain-containing protein n=1 Tax=Deinandra increscens subsp. villosa TaxID=3103831 RepID=A0AAP0GQM8_9ASTR